MAKEANKKVNNKTPNNISKKGTKKEKKENKHFLKDVRAELKKVIWPTSKQLFNNTVAVIAIVLIVGIIVLVLDLCFEKMNAFGIEKLKSVVQSTETNELIDDNNGLENDIEGNTETEGKTENTETGIQDNTIDANNSNEVNPQDVE